MRKVRAFRDVYQFCAFRYPVDNSFGTSPLGYQKCVGWVSKLCTSFWPEALAVGTGAITRYSFCSGWRSAATLAGVPETVSDLIGRWKPGKVGAVYTRMTKSQFVGIVAECWIKFFQKKLYIGAAYLRDRSKVVIVDI